MCRDKRSKPGSGSPFPVANDLVWNLDPEHVIVCGGYVPVYYQQFYFLFVTSYDADIWFAVAFEGIGDHTGKGAAEVFLFQTIYVHSCFQGNFYIPDQPGKDVGKGFILVKNVVHGKPVPVEICI